MCISVCLSVDIECRGQLLAEIKHNLLTAEERKGITEETLRELGER